MGATPVESNIFEDVLGRVTPPERISGTAGGGAVTVTLEGMSKVVAVELTAEAMEDREMLQDLLLAAMNDALGRTAAQTRSAASSLLEQLAGPLAAGLGGPRKEAP
jgi:DNA-binding protein YbaB